MFLGWLCERPFRSRFTLREEGQVELLREAPNGLSAGASLPSDDRECQYYFERPPIRTSTHAVSISVASQHQTHCEFESPLRIQRTQSDFHPQVQRSQHSRPGPSRVQVSPNECADAPNELNALAAPAGCLEWQPHPHFVRAGLGVKSITHPKV
jgi:hypothetical protein